MSVLSRQRDGSALEVPMALAMGAGEPRRALADGDMAPSGSSRHFPRAGDNSMRVVSNRGRLASGFTLIELMITLAVAVILLMIAVPSFNNLIASNRITTVANDVVDAINTARMEAVKRNSNTQLCSDLATLNTSGSTDPLGTYCSSMGAAGGVAVVINGSGVTVRSETPGLTAPVQLSGNLQALRFNAQGLAYTPTGTSPYAATVATVCTTSISKNNRRVITMGAGSIVTVTTTTGTCP